MIPIPQLQVFPKHFVLIPPEIHATRLFQDHILRRLQNNFCKQIQSNNEHNNLPQRLFLYKDTPHYDHRDPFRFPNFSGFQTSHLYLNLIQ